MDTSDTASLLVSLLVSSIGMGFVIYGKKQARPPQLIAGILLSVYTYFISSVPIMLLLAVGIVGLMAFAIKQGA